MQMTGGSRNIVYGECDPSSLKPSISWLRQALLGPGSSGSSSSNGRIKMVAIVNPNNPTGVLLTKEELQEIADVCAQAKCWLVSLRILRTRCCLLLFPPGVCPLGLALLVLDLIRLPRGSPPLSLHAQCTSNQMPVCLSICLYEQVCDNTYEYFSDFGNLTEPSSSGSSGGVNPGGHYCIAGPNVVHIFSFSKASPARLPHRRRAPPPPLLKCLNR